MLFVVLHIEMREGGRRGGREGGREEGKEGGTPIILMILLPFC